jgi:hypothetical protein
MLFSADPTVDSRMTRVDPRTEEVAHTSHYRRELPLHLARIADGNSWTLEGIFESVRGPGQAENPGRIRRGYLSRNNSVVRSKGPTTMVVCLRPTTAVGKNSLIS